MSEAELAESGRMTIALVTTSFPISGNGSEAAGSFVQDLVNELSLTVNVCVVAPGLMESREKLSSSIQVHRYRATERPLSTLKLWHPADIVAAMRIVVSGHRVLASAVQETSARHILALWALPSGGWARSVASKAGIEYSVWALGSDIWSLGRIPLLRSYLRYIMQKARYRYADGMHLAEDAAVLGGRDVAFLPSSRSLGAVYAGPTRQLAPYRLLYLGRWHPNKGVDLLLDALDLMEDDDWLRIESVAIEGGGPLNTLVHERVAVLLAAGRPVRVGAFLDKKSAIEAIGSADWLLIPSRIESIPVIFSDAMKLARPVVSMPVGDLKELVQEGGVGYCAKACDAQSFVEALRLALHDTNDRTVALTAMADRFSLQKIASRLQRDMLECP